MPWPVAFGGPVRGSSPPEPTSWRDTQEGEGPQATEAQDKEAGRAPPGGDGPTRRRRQDGRGGREAGRTIASPSIPSTLRRPYVAC